MKGENMTESDCDIYKKFDIAVQLVKSLPQSSALSPSYAEATKIYSYFKQSKFGTCSIPRPSFWDVVNRAKWDAWSALGDMAPEVAMKNYVEEIKKVYYRIKDIDAFEEKHVGFAHVLIPFCQITGTEMTKSLIEIVKEEQMKSNKSIPVNGSAYANELSQVYGDIANNVLCNGIVSANGIVNGDATSSSNDDILTSGGTAKVSKTVKFEVCGEDALKNGDSGDDGGHGNDKHNNNLASKRIENSALDIRDESNMSSMYRKEEGELSSSGKDSDEEDIYCDSLGPDQIVGVEESSAQVEVIITAENFTPVESVLITNDHVQVIENEEHIETTMEPQLFSPVSSNAFQDTTSQNILRKSDKHSRSSSNNSKSEYELVDIPIDKDNVENVCKRDTSAMTLTLCNGESSRPLSDKKRSNRKTSLTASSRSPEKLLTVECHCGMKSTKNDSSARQSHSGRGSRNKTQSGSKNENSESNASHTSNTNTSHHRRQNSNNSYRRSSEGSNNGHSGDDTCSSLSSSSSDNLGLKIVKALERMDDNMHLILNRLDSIDSSMKILAEQPPRPWWVSYLPSRSIVMSTVWPFVVQLIIYYLWRRRRRRQLRKCNATREISSVVTNLHHI